MKLEDHITLEDAPAVEELDIEKVLTVFEKEGVEILRSISEKIMTYSWDIAEPDLLSRNSYVPLSLNTQDYPIAGYVLRGFTEAGRLLIEVENVQRGSVMNVEHRPRFNIFITALPGNFSGVHAINNICKSLLSEISEKYK